MRRRLAAVFQLKGLTIQQRCVLGALADCEHPETGLCCPKMETLAKHLGMSRRQMLRVIKQLVDLKLISTRPNGRTNIYTFHFPPLGESGCDTGDTSDDDDPGCKTDCISNGSQSRSDTGVTSDVTLMTHLRCDTDYTSDVTSMSHKTIKETEKVKPSREPPSPPTVFTVSTVANTESTVGTVGGGDNEEHEKDDPGEVPATGQPDPQPEVSGRIDQQPPKQKITHPGFKWMSAFKPYTDPFAQIFAEKGCSFLTAYSPGDDIDGNTLTPAQVAIIENDPIGSALAIIGEAKNKITRQAFAKRLTWIGKEYFVGEVVRIASEIKDGTIKCNHIGKTLLRRLEYVFAFQIATDNFKQEYDINRLWEFALGNNPTTTSIAA